MPAIKFEQLIKELEGTEFYLALHQDGRRIDGAYNFMYETFLTKYANWEVADTNPFSETSDILIVDVIPPRVKANTPRVKKGDDLNGDDTREESSKRHPKVSARVRKK